MNANTEQAIWKSLDSFEIEIPSWGFAQTGTRFGKFVQPGAAVTTEHKMSDAGQVHKVTGCCPGVAVHVLWDFPQGTASAREVASIASRYGVRVGAINPNVFEGQEYKHGSLGNPDPAVRQKALQHLLDSVDIATEVGSRDISLWFGDGSNYPGTANIRHRRQWFEDGLRAAHDRLVHGERLLVEYKPFEPAFYHTDIADWGMALLLARAAGPQAKVLVDTGHHYQAQNIEQIVAWLLHDDMLGGFHFNDRHYADDDLTIASIHPYQVFRIFHEIHHFCWETGSEPPIGYMIDQSHNLKPKVEETIQTVVTAQELFVKASLVDHEALAAHQQRSNLIDAEECLKDAFATDVRPVVAAWRRSNGLPENPLAAYRESGYQQKIEADRAEANAGLVSSYA
jgi:L-rhamnose isomerase/sugar isomerase